MWLTATAWLLLAQTTDYNAEGMKALEAQKYEEAAQMFEKAIAADPKDYSAHFHMALANTMLHRDIEAVAGYKKVLELKPGLYEAELNLGMVLLRDKKSGEAVQYLDSAASKKPDQFRPQLFLADALLASGEPAKAEAAYEKAAGLDPKSAAAQLGLGQAEARQNKLGEAEPHFRKAAELDPSYKDALLELASLYEKGGQKAEAVALYEQFPDNPGARERLGELLMELGRPADAIPHLEWVVGKSPTSANRFALALAYLRTNQPEKELAVLEQAMGSEPANMDLHMIYGRALRDRKQYAAAAKQFLTVAQAKPDFLDAWNELTGMLISLEQYPQAIAVLDRIKALGGETAGHFYLRAIVLDKMHDPKAALASYEQFLAASQGKHPDEEFKARQRVRILKKEAAKR